MKAMKEKFYSEVKDVEQYIFETKPSQGACIVQLWTKELNWSCFMVDDQINCM